MLVILTLAASKRVKKGDGTVRPVCGDHFMEPRLSQEHRGRGRGDALPQAPMALSGGGEGVHADMEAGFEGGGDGKERAAPDPPLCPQH